MTNTKSWDKINPNEKLSKEEFLLLFEHLPLNTLEIEKLKSEYWVIYEKFLTSGIEPQTSWLAARNLFINKESQIGERIENQKKLQTLEN